MKTKFIIASVIVGLAPTLLLAPRAGAVEGAMGRPISGGQITPYAGLVPPAPGLAASVGEIYYQGSIGGSRTVPVGVNLAIGIKTKVSFTPIALSYIWKTPTNWAWNFASGVSLPLAWVQAKADVTLGPRTGEVQDSTFGLFDLAFVPVTASYHITPTDHLDFNFTVWTPSGNYNKNQLANLSLNNWTFIPDVAYTKLFPLQNFELSAMWALEFYTENHATDYQDGILSDLEATAIKRFKWGGGIGIVGSSINQLSDDSGPMADGLNGFRARAFGLGPILTYATHIGPHPLNFGARWVGEFENKNYFQGDLFMVNATFEF